MFIAFIRIYVLVFIFDREKMVGFVFLVYIVEYIDSYIKFMNNIFIRYCLILKKKIMLVGILYILFMWIIFVYIIMFFCV